MEHLTSPFTLSDYRCFSGRRDECRKARLWVRDLLAGVPTTADAVEVVTSELFSNALRHTDSGSPNGTVDVSLIGLACGVVHLEVIDAGGTAHRPTATRPGMNHTAGRGLLLVSALCHTWGHLPADGDPRRGVTTPTAPGYTGPLITWAEFAAKQHP